MAHRGFVDGIFHQLEHRCAEPCSYLTLPLTGRERLRPGPPFAHRPLRELVGAALPGPAGVWRPVAARRLLWRDERPAEGAPVAVGGGAARTARGPHRA